MDPVHYRVSMITLLARMLSIVIVPLASGANAAETNAASAVDPNTTSIQPASAVSFAQSLRLSMIIDQESGPKKIGFVDGRTKKSYTLSEGESEDGIEMVSADFHHEVAVLRCGAEMALIKLSSGEVKNISPDYLDKIEQGQLPDNGERKSYGEWRKRIDQIGEKRRRERRAAEATELPVSSP